MERAGFVYETVNVWDGDTAKNISIINYRGKRFNLDVLDNPLTFGDREQIKALKIWELMHEINEKENEN